MTPATSSRSADGPAPGPGSQPEPGVAAVIVLAAGGGTRMRSKRSKLLHEVGGRSMLAYAIDAATALNAERIAVVVGHEKEQVVAHLDQIAPHVLTVEQGAEAYGTGYAVQCALRQLGEVHGEVVVTLSDMPMVDGPILTDVVTAHRRSGAEITVLTAEVDDPTGYGRVLREPSGDVVGIVEQKDATPEQLAVSEINSGVFVFDGQVLGALLTELAPSETTGEYYLTHLPALAREQRRTVRAHISADPWHAEGVNDRVQLQAMAAEMNRRTCERWMLAGVTILDPSTTWIHASVELGSDVTLLPNTSLEGATTVADGARIGPDTTLVDTEVGDGASVIRTTGTLAVIGAGASVGPYAYLRPGTVLGAQGKIGTFVETKNAEIGPGAKVPHLCYAGDATIEEGANIGAGVIFANYDGVTKSRTRVGRFSFVGSDSTLVAPVEVQDGAYVAAGSTVTRPVSAGELAVARGQQRNVKGWVARKRSGTKTAAAAESAGRGSSQPEETSTSQTSTSQTSTSQTSTSETRTRETGAR